MNVASVFAAVDASKLISNAVYWNFLGAWSSDNPAPTTFTATLNKKEYTINSANAGIGASVKTAVEYSTTTGLKFTADSDTLGVKFNNNKQSTDVTSGNYLSIPVSAGSTLYVYACASSSSKAASLKLLKSTSPSDTLGDAKNVATSTYQTAEEYKFDIPKTFTGNTVYLISPSNGVSISAIVEVLPTASSEFEYFKTVQKDSSYYVIGRILRSVVNSNSTINEVGFKGGKSETTVSNNELLSTATVASTIRVDGEDIIEPDDNYYYAAFEIDQIADTDDNANLWVAAFADTNNGSAQKVEVASE
jgi:hypothetical protein